MKWVTVATEYLVLDQVGRLLSFELPQLLEIYGQLLVHTELKVSDCM